MNGPGPSPDESLQRVRNAATPAPGRPRVSVRHAADISRLTLRLFTRWTLPRVELQIDGLPKVVVQHAQYRFARISETCNCVLAVALAAITLLGGSYRNWASMQSWIWTSRQYWQHLGVIAMAALVAGLIGWMLEAAWTRLRLVRVLHGLRHRLVTGEIRREPGHYEGRTAERSAAQRASAGQPDAAADEDSRPRPYRSRPGRPRLLVRSTADRHRLAVHLFTHWRVPRVEIGADGAAMLDLQRAQHRLARLSQSCSCLLGAGMAALTLLGGGFWVAWTSQAQWQWWMSEGWGPLGRVALAAPCAAVLGVAIETVWTRVRMVLVLRGIRHRLAA